MSPVRFVAIGDSFTEGVGDERPDGTVRGWADLVAAGWAASRGSAISYANLAIRGKLVWPIVDEELSRALALHPTHLSFNGGGNDMLRPRTPIRQITAAFEQVQRRCVDAGVRLIVLSGANPSAHLPLGGLIQRRGDLLSASVTAQLGDADVLTAFNWPDAELSRTEYWSPDRLHMNARGHHRVAARVLRTLGEYAPEHWWSLPDSPVGEPLGRRDYLREHLGPWIRRRLTGTSSGDGHEPKHPDWVTIHP